MLFGVADVIAAVAATAMFDVVVVVVVWGVAAEADEPVADDGAVVLVAVDDVADVVDKNVAVAAPLIRYWDRLAMNWLQPPKSHYYKHYLLNPMMAHYSDRQATLW